MESAVATIIRLADEADLATHKKTLDTLRNLVFALERPGDTIQRLLYMPIQPIAAKIANNVRLFSILMNSGGPMSSADLALETNVAPILMKRLLRYMASVGMVKETAEDTFGPTNISSALIDPGMKAGINFGVEVMLPCLQKLPGFLADAKYNDITGGTDCPFQRGLNTEQDAIAWLHTHPAHLEDFTRWMIAHHEGMPMWLTVFPFKEISSNFDYKKPLFVDVGGGVGHQCLAVQKAHPQLVGPGRIFLQDFKETLQHALPMEGVDNMVYDFFTPQPVKGAKFYYMRNCLHNHPDDSCKLILRQTMTAMTEDSMILIDEMVLPDTSVHMEAAQLDMWMMSAVGAMERTKKQWYSLLESVGLRVDEIYTYTDSLKDSVIVAVLG